MTVETDEQGRIDVPHHDGELIGVLCEGTSRVSLTFRCTRGVRRQIVLSGVHAMDISSFRNGNIILSMMVFPPDLAKRHVPEAMLRRLGHGRLASLAGKHVFVLDASYGAEVIADCDGVEVVELNRSREALEDR